MLDGACNLSFTPVAKCCTYLPTLTNFQVGDILGSEDPELASGKRSLQLRLAGQGVSPWGLIATETASADDGVRRFGVDPELKCPHFLDGGCSIWASRPAACASWFCKHDRGLVGQRHWRRVLQFGAMVESELAFHCAMQVGDARMKESLLDRLIPRPGQTTELSWGSWQGRHAEFYVACAAELAGRSAGELLDLCGPRVHLAVDILRRSAGALNQQSLPEALQVGDVHRVDAKGGPVTLVGYSEYDPLEVDPRLADALPWLAGPSATVTERVERQLGLHVDTELIRLLLDFDIMRDAGQ
ncbi:MAG: hypothetical protein KC912_16650 [Proteobacteria bacterium]|nr:hypothetical protein [Pseudomonadota bacterium]